MTPRIAGLTFVALCAFAANSVLARLALSKPSIDPASFTLIRVASGALMLALVGWYRAGHVPFPDRHALVSGFWLFAYAIAFAWAYLALGASTGALILFASVQVAMIALGLAHGERLGAIQACGVMAAMGGLVWLLSPRLHAPPLLPALAMTLAGIAWAVYTMRARRTAKALEANAMNFAAALPLCSAVAWFAGWSDITAYGAALAAISGAVASGLGYVVWYAALGGLAATQAAVVQLAVPVIAAIAGIALLGETLTSHLIGAGAVILAGIAMSLAPRR